MSHAESNSEDEDFSQISAFINKELYNNIIIEQDNIENDSSKDTSVYLVTEIIKDVVELNTLPSSNNISNSTRRYRMLLVYE